jgi:hypothetical protein
MGQWRGCGSITPFRSPFMERGQSNETLSLFSALLKIHEDAGLSRVSGQV